MVDVFSMGGLALFWTTHSWYTSLNILFFYLTWRLLLATHTHLTIIFLGTALVRAVFYWIPTLAFLAFDTLVPTLAASLKIRGRAGVASRWPERLHILAWSLANMALGAGLHALAEHLTGPWIRVSPRLPLPREVLAHVLAAFALREAAAYCAHRALQHGRGPLARPHRAWQHRVAAPWAAVAHYDHPLSYLAGRGAPLVAAAVSPAAARARAALTARRSACARTC